jgi:AmmeMemoRadiSam system protein A
MSAERGRNIRIYEPLAEEEQRYLLESARGALESACMGGSLPQSQPPSRLSHLLECRGVFVSLHKETKLRGCVGRHTSDLPLYRLVPEMAVASGFQDPRFPPLRKEELKRVEIEISVYLSGIVTIDDPSDFQVGKHGIIFKKGAYASTFLPHVAVEQGWDRETTFRYLCMKAGLSADSWKDGDAEFAVYETQIFHE